METLLDQRCEDEMPRCQEKRAASCFACARRGGSAIPPKRASRACVQHWELKARKVRMLFCVTYVKSQHQKAGGEGWGREGSGRR